MQEQRNTVNPTIQTKPIIETFIQICITACKLDSSYSSSMIFSLDEVSRTTGLEYGMKFTGKLWILLSKVTVDGKACAAVIIWLSEFGCWDHWSSNSLKPSQIEESSAAYDGYSCPLVTRPHSQFYISIGAASNAARFKFSNFPTVALIWAFTHRLRRDTEVSEKIADTHNKIITHSNTSIFCNHQQNHYIK